MCALLSVVSAVILPTAVCVAQDIDASAGISMDKTVWNFGDILLSDGPVSCTFSLTNTSSENIEIQSVNTSCGCTDVKWTKGPIAPGAKGGITVTYSNNEGPIPFDKTLTMYLSSRKKPVILRVRGVSHERKLSLEEAYPVRSGSFGFKTDDIKVGNLEQGGYKSTTLKVANFASSAQTVSFSNVSENLTVKAEPAAVPPGGTADITVTVKASRKLWGKNYYYATAPGGLRLGFWAITKENFSSLTKEQKDAAARITFKDSNFSVGKIKRGSVVDARFEFTDTGRSPLTIYAANTDTPGVEISFDSTVKPGAAGTVNVHCNTSALTPSDDFPFIIFLYTNCPSRPIVTLFVVGVLE